MEDLERLIIATDNGVSCDFRFRGVRIRMNKNDSNTLLLAIKEKMEKINMKLDDEDKYIRLYSKKTFNDVFLVMCKHRRFQT